MKYAFLILLLIILQGCATVPSITANYHKIDFSRGVSEFDARLIAKMQIIFTNFRHFFRIILPVSLRSKAAQGYPDYWFISFFPKHRLAFSYRYLVVIEKRTGKAVFSDMCHLNELSDFSWVFKNK